MAINQVSLFFYAPRWEQHLRPAAGAVTAEGTPVQLASAVPITGGEEQTVSSDAVKGWLAERGFSPVDWGDGWVFERGKVRSIFGTEQDIIIHVHEDAGEVSELYCRFTLPRRKPPPVMEWAALVSSLCAEFQLRLAGSHCPCSEQEFIEAVFESGNYRAFASQLGWPGGE